MTDIPQHIISKKIDDAYSIVNGINFFHKTSIDYNIIIQIIAIFVALVTFLLTRKYNISISRKRATIDLIQLSNSNDFYSKRYDFVNARNNLIVDEVAGPLFLDKNSPLKKDHVSRARLLWMLNYYEFVCIGLKNGAYDEGIYYDWLRSTVVRDWILLKEFIEKFRSEDLGNRKEVFKKYEKLVKKWANNKERKNI